MKIKSSKHWAVLLCLGMFVVIVLLSVSYTSSEGEAEVRSRGSAPRPHARSDVDARLKVEAERYRKARERIGVDNWRYHLSTEEAERFLQDRGKTPASLLFLLLCTENRQRYIPEIQALPDSALKFHVLWQYAKQDDPEKVEYARRMTQMDPENKVGHLALALSLIESGQGDASALALVAASKAPNVDASNDEVLAEFGAARGVLGLERAYQLAELHSGLWAQRVAGDMAPVYLDSIDPSSFSDGGKVDGFRILDHCRTFLASLGLHEAKVETEALGASRSYLPVLKSNFGAKQPELKKELIRLRAEWSRELDSALIENIAKNTATYGYPMETRYSLLLGKFAESAK